VVKSPRTKCALLTRAKVTVTAAADKATDTDRGTVPGMAITGMGTDTVTTTRKSAGT
jgi:hypothetical protein